MTFIWALFFASHFQSMEPMLAPASLTLLVVCLAITRNLSTFVPNFVGIGILLIAYLVAISFWNGAMANKSLTSYLGSEAREIYTLITILVFTMIKRSFDIERKAFAGLTLAALVVAVSSLFSIFVHPLEYGFVSFSKGALPQGPFGGANPLAGMLGSVLVVIIVQWADPKILPGRHRRFFAISALVISTVFVMCQSRGYTLGLVAGGVVALAAAIRHQSIAKRIRLRVMLGFLALPIVVAGLLQALARRLANVSQDANVLTRLGLWDRAWDMIQTSPVFGFGLGSFEQRNLRVEIIIDGLIARRESGWYADFIEQHTVEGGLHVHNVFLQLLVETGLVGTLLLFSMIYIAITSANAINRSGEYNGAILSAKIIFPSLIFLAVSGLTAGYTLVSLTTCAPFWFAVSRVIRARPDGESKRGAQVEVRADVLKA